MKRARKWNVFSVPFGKYERGGHEKVKGPRKEHFERGGVVKRGRGIELLNGIM